MTLLLSLWLIANSSWPWTIDDLSAMKKKILIIIIVLLTLAIATIAYFVNSNTHFLNFFPNSEEIAKNNDNFSGDLSQHRAQTVIVPDKYQEGIFSEERILNLPENFEISVFAVGLTKPRFFVVDPNNNLFVTDISQGKLFFIPDNNQDGVADNIVEVDSGLRNPHGIDIFENDVYVAEEHQVVVYRAVNEDGTYFTKEILITGLPQVGNHVTRTIRIGPDEKIYLTVGSSCNICEEDDSRRAAMLRYNLDGTGEEIIAEGLRNTVGFDFEFTNDEDIFKIWSVDNGRDLIGDDLPPEEVNVIEDGKHYGWPFCYGRKTVNPEYENEREDFCINETENPAYIMQAHSAPLDIRFIPSETDKQSVLFPRSLKDNIFISFHGSWNRTVPTGYKVITIDTSDEEDNITDFITGWLQEDGEIWGRPVGLGFDLDGSMFITDDKEGVIYKVVYTP